MAGVDLAGAGTDDFIMEEGSPAAVSVAACEVAGRSAAVIAEDGKQHAQGILSPTAEKTCHLRRSRCRAVPTRACARNGNCLRRGAPASQSPGVSLAQHTCRRRRASGGGPRAGRRGGSPRGMGVREQWLQAEKLFSVIWKGAESRGPCARKTGNDPAAVIARALSSDLPGKIVCRSDEPDKLIVAKCRVISKNENLSQQFVRRRQKKHDRHRNWNQHVEE